MDSSVKAAVFIDTNLGTHIALSVTPDITAGDLKRELGNEHSNCFPNIGEIRVSGLLVKRRSCFYHLPDSIPIKNAFHGLKGAWFLRMDVIPMNNSNNPDLSESLIAEFRGSVSNGSVVTDSGKPENHSTCTDKNIIENKARKRKIKKSECLEGPLKELQTPVYVAKKKKKSRTKEKCFPEEAVNGSEERIHSNEAPCLSLQKQFCNFDSWKEKEKREECTSRPTVETPSVSLSEVVSVTGIITRYFPEFDEVKSSDGPSWNDVNNEFGACGTYQGQLNKPKTKMNEHFPKALVHSTPQCIAKTPHKIVSLSMPADPSPETSRGKLGRTEVGKRLVLAANDLGISTNKKKPSIPVCQSKGVKLSSSLVRNIVFEVSDSDH